MSFIWPAMLLLLLTIPVGVALYLVRERRRRARMAAFGVSGGVARLRRRGAPAAPARPADRRGIRRRLPAVLVVAGLTILVASLARPQSVVGVPRIEGTVILAFDVSGSMAATDLAPTRMEAAKAAARAFVERQPSSVRIGVVAFSDSGFSVQVPTNEPSEVVAAIDRLGPGARHVAGERHRGLAADHRDRRRPAADRLLLERLAGAHPAADPGPEGHVRPGDHRAGHRRGEHHRPRPAPVPPRRPPTAASGSTRSGSGPRPGPRSRSRASASTRPSTRTRSGRSRRGPTARTTRPPTRRRSPRSTTTSRSAWSSTPSRWRSPRCSPAPASCCC